MDEQVKALEGLRDMLQRRLGPERQPSRLKITSFSTDLSDYPALEPASWLPSDSAPLVICKPKDDE